MTSIEQWEGFSPKENISVSRREYHGPCAADGSGNDRFVVWPMEGNNGRYFCRHGCPGCKSSGDIVDYLQQFCGLSFADAYKRTGREYTKNKMDWMKVKREPAVSFVGKAPQAQKDAVKEYPRENPVESVMLKEKLHEIDIHPINGWCYLGQKYCDNLKYIERFDVEKCTITNTKHGHSNVDLLTVCPAEKE